MTETAQPRHACRVCTRSDLSLTANGRVRSHAANGKRPGPDNPNCPGGSDLPRGHEPEPVQVTASGGPNPYRAPLPDHTHRYEYADDGNGHSGSFCPVCGNEEPPNLPHDRTTEEHDPWQPPTPSPAQKTPESPEAPGPGSAPAMNPSATDAAVSSTKGISSVPTETVGTRDRTAAVTIDVFDSPAPVAQRAEQKVERDGWGRYRLIHPTTGKKQAWQRCTTFAKMLEDTFGLGVWQQRMVAKGLALRPDLLDIVTTLEVKRDAERLNQILEQAKDAAGQKVAANQGTVCHKHTEDVDRGELTLDQVPPRYRADVTAYTETLRRAGITIVPQMIERITVVPDLSVGGTLDRVVRARNGKYYVLDVKTGNMDFGQLGICIQLAVYAAGVNSAGVYDLDTGTWAPPNSYGDSIETGPWSVPHVETDYALVAHIPVGSGTCELLKVPIDTGWEAVQTAAQVRDWRKKKRLFTAYDPEDVAPGEAEVKRLNEIASQPPTWEDRFRAVTSRAEAMKLYEHASRELGQGVELGRLVQIGMATLEQLSG